MPQRHKMPVTWLFVFGVFVSACDSSEGSNSSSSSNGGSGDSTTTTTNGGSTQLQTGTGGASVIGDATTTSSGGKSSAGGVSSAGGKSSTGGTANAGGKSSVGGASNIGGKSSTLGGASAGGKSSTGGTSSIGGSAGGAPYRGVANSPCNARTNLKVSWYYNWMQTANEPCSSPSIGGEFVPMIWGKSGEQSASAITSAISKFVANGNQYVLGFNEPDNTSQSNISVATAISLWSAFNNPSIKIGTPASQANTSGVSWFKDFNTQLNADSTLRADFIAIHWYGWNAGSCDAKASTLESYIKQIEALPGNRPIWLTEWGCLNGSDNGSAETTQAHIAGAVAMFAKHPRLERYAWYPWATDAHQLNNDDGSLTTLGTYYASLPAYK
jgi:Glycosyl hydrolase catalytic core